MKKILLAASIVLGASTITGMIAAPQMDVSAKTTEMSASFAKKLKEGGLPNTKGKIGMTYKTLKKVVPKKKEYAADKYVYMAKNKDMFYLNYNEKLRKPKNTNTVVALNREYSNLISSSSVKKQLGKPYRGKSIEGGKDVGTHIYKAGKNYVYIYADKKSNTTSLYMGKRDLIQMLAGVSDIYR